MNIIIGVLAWVVVFVIGANLIHTPGQEWWGLLFIAVCGSAIGISLARIGGKVS